MQIDRHLLYRWNGVTSLANPFSHHHHNTPGAHEVPTSRPASAADVSATLSAASTELLDYLEASGYAPHELSNTAAALGYTETQLEAWAAGEERGELPIEESYYRTRLAAAMVEKIIENKATISDIPILQASLADLREWDGFYADTLRELWTEIRTHEDTITSGNYSESPRWCVLEAKFRRIAGFLWAVRSRLGLELFTGNLVVQRVAD